MVKTPAKRGRKSILYPQRRQLILNFIHEYRRVRDGFSPSFVELARGIGYSPSAGGTVHTLVNQLIDEGWLKCTPGTARTLFPLKPATEVYCPIADDDLKRIAKLQKGLKILA